MRLVTVLDQALLLTRYWVWPTLLEIHSKKCANTIRKQHLKWTHVVLAGTVISTGCKTSMKYLLHVAYVTSIGKEEKFHMSEFGTQEAQFCSSYSTTIGLLSHLELNRSS